jgi:hypothetical protein
MQSARLVTMVEMSDPRKALKAMDTALEALTPLDAEERRRAMIWLSETLEVSIELEAAGGGEDEEELPATPRVKRVPTTAVEKQTPKEFLAAKEPRTDVERLTCLAYFLTKVRETPTFNTADLTALNTEAAGRRFSNAPATGKNATNQNGYLASAEGRKRQITHLGEQLVEAMPDREAVKSVLSGGPKIRRRRSSRKSKGTKSSKS